MANMTGQTFDSVEKHGTKKQKAALETLKSELKDRLLHAYISEADLLVIHEKSYNGKYYRRTFYGPLGGFRGTATYSHYDFEDNMPYGKKTEIFP